jgi:D-xylose transport system ATP-binding protein
VSDGAALLELRDVRKEFPGVRALDGVSFDLRAGEVHALCGENGAGKSTLINVLCGVHPAGSYSGELLVDGRPARFRNLHDSAGRGIALIAQELALVPELSVAENLLLGREPSRLGRIDWREVERRAIAALARVGLEVSPDAVVRTLGIGQQQMVEIAKALDKDARILVLDEPTAALSAADAERLRELLLELRSRGVASIYISHRLEEVFALADRLTVLRDGRSVATVRRAAIEPRQVIAQMVGRDVSQSYPRAATPDARDAVLGVEDWTVADPQNAGQSVVERASFELHRGEILGIAGLVGAGRTALLASIFGAARAGATGRLRIAGGDPRPPFRSPREALAEGVALLSEDRKRFGLVPRGSVEDNLALAALGGFTRRGWIDDGARRSAVAAQSERLHLRAPSLDAPVAQLSGGNQQKVLLGRWLLRKPRVLLLDEPTRGIDVGARREIYEIIARLVEEGTGVLLVSSDLPELLGLSHRVLVLAEGRVVARFEALEATAERVMSAATVSRR